MNLVPIKVAMKLKTIYVYVITWSYLVQVVIDYCAFAYVRLEYFFGQPSSKVLKDESIKCNIMKTGLAIFSELHFIESTRHTLE